MNANPRLYSRDTYRKYDLLQDAINDFTNAMHVGRIRLARDPSYVIQHWDQLGVAIGEFFDHLTDTYDYTDELALTVPSGSGGAVSPPTPPSPAGASGDNSSIDGAP